MKPWYQSVRLWGQVNLTEDDPRKCDLAEWEDYWKRTGTEGVIINCGGIVSYYPSRFASQYRAKSLGDMDFFGLWNEAARKAGLAVVARMDINCTGEELFRLHPDWYCRDKEQQPVLSQGRYVACVNGGYYQKFIPEIFREVIEKYRPDGFADNSWAGPGDKTICYCETCRREFREAYQEELPARADWEDPVYRKWIRWSYETRGRNWQYFNRITQKYGGKDCRWFGMINANPFRTGGRFYDLKRLAEHAPFIFCDHQSRDESCGFEQNYCNGALLGSASGGQVIVAESMAHYYKGERTFRLCGAEAGEARRWMMCGLSGGISPWYHFVGAQNRDRRRLKLTPDLFCWAKEQEQWLSNRETFAQIGVVWSQETITYYGRDRGKERCEYPWLGVTRALSEAGLPFWPVHADDLEKYADRLELLILPNTAVLRPEQEQKLVDWLKKGKALILTGDTGLYDEEGQWKGPGTLWEVLGLTPGKYLEGARTQEKEDWLRGDGHSYLRILGADDAGEQDKAAGNREESIEGNTERSIEGTVDPPHMLWKLVEGTELIPFGGSVRAAKSSGPLKPQGVYVPPFPIYPPEFSWIRDGGTLPAVYAGSLESGARVVYLAADLDRCYGRNHIPDQRKVLEGCVLWALDGNLRLQAQASAHVHASVYRKENAYVVHLVNLAGTRVAPGTMEETLPVGPVKVQFCVKEPVSSVRGCVQAKTYEYTQKEGRTEIVIPCLEEQELLIVSCGQEEGGRT